MSAIASQIPITFVGVDRVGTVPAWARDFGATQSTVADLCEADELTGIAVVQSSGPRKILDSIDVVSKLFEFLVHTPDLSCRLVLGFTRAKPKDILNLAPTLAKYPGLSGRVELACRSVDLEEALFEAMTKVLATRREKDPLGEVQSVIKTGRALRAASGRLDAGKVAKAFGLSLAELARQIGESKQRISKTPDSEALQSLLRPYERIGRLRAVLADADFKAWLNTPNEHLEDGDAPIGYLKAGAQEPLANFAENMLTGSPA